MPTQKQIKVMAKKQGISTERMSKKVFGHMRKLGWKPKREGGPTKRWHQRKHVRINNKGKSFKAGKL